MTPQSSLPRLARWLLRVSPVTKHARSEVLTDLHELFDSRRRDRGAFHAHWRLYHDVASLWLHRQPMARRPASRSARALLHDVAGDLRYAVRLFARQPAILLLTLIGLSLGLGIATAAFSMMNAAVLRGEGLVDSDRAPGILRVSDRSVSTAWSYDEFLQLRDGATRTRVNAIFTDGAVVRTGAAETDVRLRFVSGGFFGVTGGRMMAGRSLDAVDERQPDLVPVVVSFVFWNSRLDRDPHVIGRTIWIGRTAATIVGVAARGFSLPNNAMIWLPLAAYGDVYGMPPTRAPQVLVEVFGRLLPDVTSAEAEAELSGVAAAVPAEARLRVRLDPKVGLGRVSSATTFALTIVVLAVIALVLVLACANVATVLISAAITREREMGVRAALGASRWRIVQQLVTESLALGVLASSIGLLCSYWAIPVIATMIEAPEGADLAPDLHVYLFLGIVTLISGVGAGLAPAWHSRGADLLTPLKGEGARENRVAPRRLRSMLIMTQAAASVLLIVLATLFVRATIRAATVDVGFDSEGLYAIWPGVDSGQDGAGIRRFWAQAIPELQNLPGIASVSLAEMPPFAGAFMTAITREQPPRVVYLNRTRANYFDTLGLRIVDGRAYTAGEIAANAPVALISQSLARAYWHGQSPLGQLLPQEIPLPPSRAPKGSSAMPSPRPIIIGVVTDAVTARLSERSTFAIYQPLYPATETFARLIIRLAPGSTGVMQQVTQRLRAIDPKADLRITSVAAGLKEEASRPRMLATLTGFVGIVAIVLCVIGLYGLTASVVGQRTREMGVRMAMGAQRNDIVRLLMWDCLRPVAVGILAGIGAAVLASRIVFAALFFGISPRDPIAFAGAAVILLLAAVLAVLMPTRRAASVDAAFVLRQS